MPKNGPFDVLQPTSKASRDHQIICAIKDAPIVPPKILRDWVEDESRKIHLALQRLTDFKRSGELDEATDAEKLQAKSIALNGIDFLDLAEMARDILPDEEDPNLSQSFLLGLRMGMLHDNLTTLAKGLHKRHWEQHERLYDARAKKNGADKGANSKRAKEALKKAKKRHPSKTLTTQKKRAADDLGISVRTLNRWLKAT